jgi:hypothetical protein
MMVGFVQDTDKSPRLLGASEVNLKLRLDHALADEERPSDSTGPSGVAVGDNRRRCGRADDGELEPIFDYIISVPI